MENVIKLELGSVLPGGGSACGGCGRRLETVMQTCRGLKKAHLALDGEQPAALCLHYDPDLVGVDQLRRMAQQAGLEIAARYKHDTIPITGMDCSDCALVVEHSLGRMPGVIHAAVNYASRKLRVEYDSRALTRGDIEQRIRALGYEVPLNTRRQWLKDNGALLKSLSAGALLAAGWAAGLAPAVPQAVSAGLYLSAYAVGGWDISRHAFHALREKHFDTDLLMALAALGAAALGEFAEGALLIFLFSLGHALEERAMDKARRAIESLADLAPRTAQVRRAGQEVELAVEELAIGDVVIARPGVRIPADGTVLSGSSGVDQSPVTGESIPVWKTMGGQVFAGSINGEGVLEVTVTRLAADSTLARVVRMVEEAQSRKSPTHRFIERLERVFIPGVLAATALAAVLPPLFGAPLRASFLRAMTLLVAASPCALALGAPAATLAGLARAARMGVLIKGGVHLENLGRIKAVAFDKTGTVTRGRPEVTAVVSFDPEIFPPREVLALAASLENRSGHPLAAAVVRAAREEHLELPAVESVTSLTGRGLRAKYEKRTVLLGSLNLLQEEGIEIPSDARIESDALEVRGNTVLLAALDGRAAGLIALADTLRPEAPAAVRGLRDLGVEHLVMLSGDNQAAADDVAGQAGLSGAFANQLPGEKASAITALETEYGPTAMVGDGVNDAPALASATVGIAMGGAATDAALETADVALMGSDLSRLPFAVGLGRAANRIIRQNMVIALGVIAVLSVSSLAGWSGMGAAVFFHEGSTLLVVLNALRLLGYRPG